MTLPAANLQYEQQRQERLAREALEVAKAVDPVDNQIAEIESGVILSRPGLANQLAQARLVGTIRVRAQLGGRSVARGAVGGTCLIYLQGELNEKTSMGVAARIEKIWVIDGSVEQTLQAVDELSAELLAYAKLWESAKATEGFHRVKRKALCEDLGYPSDGSDGFQDLDYLYDLGIDAQTLRTSETLKLLAKRGAIMQQELAAARDAVAACTGSFATHRHLSAGIMDLYAELQVLRAKAARLDAILGGLERMKNLLLVIAGNTTCT